MNDSINGFDSSKGFTPTNDIFGRKNFYLKMLSVINNSPEHGMVIALEDRWGQGKTSFVKMMQAEINNTPEFNDKLNAIYFDAYSNDFHEDPFIPISAEFHGLFSEPKSNFNKFKDEFLKIATRVGAATLSGGLKAVISSSTLGLVNGNEVIKGITEAVKDSAKDTVNDLTNSLAAYVEKKITAAKEEKVDIENFRKILSEIHKKTGQHTIFIIDELDRAKPDFSLDLLEKIKHLFSVEHVTFILVMNREQFEKVIEKRYGNIDSRTYLNKFVNIFSSLPKIQSADLQSSDLSLNSTIYKYIKSMPEAGSLFDYGSSFHNELSYLIEINKCSLREAERCISLMSLFSSQDGKIKLRGAYATALVIMIFLKVYDSSLYEDFMSKKTTVAELLKSLRLDKTPELRVSIVNTHNDIVRLIKFHHFSPSYIREHLQTLLNDFDDINWNGAYPINPFMSLKEGLENFYIDYR